MADNSLRKPEIQAALNWARAAITPKLQCGKVLLRVPDDSELTYFCTLDNLHEGPCFNPEIGRM